MTENTTQAVTSSSIRTTKIGDTIAFCARDVCKSIGVAWGGNSLRGVSKENIKTAKIMTKNSGRNSFQNHSVLTAEGVDELCTARGKENPVAQTQLVSPDNVQADRKIKALENQVDNLKQLVARMALRSGNPQVAAPKELTSAPVSDTVVKPVNATNQLLQGSARKEIRFHCEKYADQWATSDGITTKEDKKLYFDLVYNALYTSFKNTHPDAPDLRKTARDLTQETGEKVSALQIAEQQGYAVKLLKLARELFPLNK